LVPQKSSGNERAKKSRHMYDDEKLENMARYYKLDENYESLLRYIKHRGLVEGDSEQ
jgi:hypothetical protein